MPNTSSHPPAWHPLIQPGTLDMLTKVQLQTTMDLTMQPKQNCHRTPACSRDRERRPGQKLGWPGTKLPRSQGGEIPGGLGSSWFWDANFKKPSKCRDMSNLFKKLYCIQPRSSVRTRCGVWWGDSQPHSRSIVVPCRAVIIKLTRLSWYNKGSGSGVVSLYKGKILSVVNRVYNHVFY
jgi:hypothetical protein